MLGKRSSDNTDNEGIKDTKDKSTDDGLPSTATEEKKDIENKGADDDLPF